MELAPADRLALGALQAALQQARDAHDERPALEVLAGCLAELGVRATPSARSAELIRRDRDAWLRRLQSAQRSQSTISAYRIAIYDLLTWAEQEQRTRELFQEQAIVDYLADYRRARAPAAATYYRRFVLLRRFMAWLARRHGTPDPFLELQAPPKPCQERDWLTHEEFRQLLASTAHPKRRRPGIVARDRLVLLALVLTGLRRAELIDVRWIDLDLDGAEPSLLVRRGKAGKPRRQPLPFQLVAELKRWRAARQTRAAPARLLRPGRRPAAAERTRRHHPPQRRPCRPCQARHGAHVAPHRRDLAATGHRRHAPCRRVSRTRRPIDRRPLHARRKPRDARRRAGAGRSSRPGCLLAASAAIRAGPGGS